MTENLRLKNWVEKKLDSGVDPERVRESLNNTGRDPEIVDRVLKERNPDTVEEKKKVVEEETSEPVKEMFEDTEPEKKEEKGIDLSPTKEKEEESRETSGKKEGKSKPKKIEEIIIKREKSLEQNLNNLHIPIKPVLVLLTVGLLFGGYALFGNTDMEERIGNPLSSADWDEPREDCDLDSGFLITEAEQVGNSIEAEVRVTNSPEDVVLEVFDGETRAGYALESFEGVETVEVDASGDRLVFRPQGCDNRYDDQDL